MSLCTKLLSDSALRERSAQLELAALGIYPGLLTGVCLTVVVAVLEFRSHLKNVVDTMLFDAIGLFYAGMVTALGYYGAMSLSVRIAGSVDAPGVASAIAIATYIAMGLVVALCIGWIVRIVRHPEPKYRFWTPTTIGTGLACAAVASSVLLFALVRLVQSISSSLTT